MPSPTKEKGIQTRCFTKLLLAGSLLYLGISALYPVSAQPIVNQSSTGVPVRSLNGAIASARQVNGNALSNGIYHFGQSTKPEQIRQEYFVFELENDKVMGAFYMPYSSFDCFYGHLQNGELNLTITSSYDKAVYPYSVSLKDYQPVSSINTNNQKILNTCKTAYQAQLRQEQGK